MDTLVDELIDAHRACNDNLVASGWTDMDAWEECVDAADAKFREDCDDDADCPQELEDLGFELGVQDDDFWDDVMADSDSEEE